MEAFDNFGIPNLRTPPTPKFPTGRFRGQTLVNLSTPGHREQLHKLWDIRYPQFSRRHGARNIEQQLRDGKITPRQLLNMLEDFYLLALEDYPSDLIRVFVSMRVFRNRIGV